jgi:hypothetical protein
MGRLEPSMLLINRGISKNLLLLLEKLIEFLGEKFIGKYGHIFMFLDVIDVVYFFTFLKWVIAKFIKLL